MLDPPHHHPHTETREARLPETHEPDDERPLRVVEMVTIFGMGGIARHALGLGRWLKGRGHKVYLAGSHGDWVDEGAFDGFLPLETLKVGGEGGALPKRLGHLAASTVRLRRWLRASEIDVIHAHESAPALVAMIARVGLSIPVIVTYHGSDPKRIKGFGAIARHADKVVTPSYRAAEDLAELGGVPREKLSVIGLGVDPAPDDYPDDVAALRSKLLGEGTHLVVTIARIAYQKGIDVLVDCVQQLMKVQPGIRFVVIGDGPLEREMKNLAREKGVDGHLTFAGRNDTPFRFLRAADLMLLTSRWEALPISIVEAFQTGTPVVATDCSGVVQLVDDSVGARVPVGDVEAITHSVSRILSDDSLREAMGRNALERSREDRFDPDHVHSIFEQLYRDIRKLN